MKSSCSRICSVIFGAILATSISYSAFDTPISPLPPPPPTGGGMVAAFDTPISPLPPPPPTIPPPSAGGGMIA